MKTQSLVATQKFAPNSFDLKAYNTQTDKNRFFNNKLGNKKHNQSTAHETSDNDNLDSG